MGRKRQLDPGIWTSEQFINLADPWARLLFIGIISNADDEGRIKAGAPYLKAIIFPADAFTLEQVTEWRTMLVRQGLVIVYTCDGKDYIHLPTWRKYQYISKPYASKLPVPPEPQAIPEPVSNHSVTVPALQHSIGNGIGIGIGNEVVSSPIPEPVAEQDIKPKPAGGRASSKQSKDITLQFLDEMAEDFPSLNIDRELKKCRLYWRERKNKDPSPRAFFNWLEKAVKIQAENSKDGSNGRPNSTQRNHKGPPPDAGREYYGADREPDIPWPDQ